jgi:uncharacterized protein (UPF0335 family)
MNPEPTQGDKTNRLDEIVAAIYARGQLSGVDGKKPMINDLKTMLQQYIDSQVREARIDEVSKIVATYEQIRDVMYDELKKKGFDTSISIKAVELLISNMKERLSELKGNNGEQE